MAQLNDAQKAELRALAAHYELKGHHFHSDRRGFVIITRAGIEQIAAKAGIRVKFSEVHEWSDAKENRYVVKAEAWMGAGDAGSYVMSYGEVTAKNNSNTYPVAMAEKRALSRAVLKLAGMYRINVYGEDEIQNESK